VNYYVDWKQVALDGLTAAWVDVADKGSVNDAEAEITRLLGRDPLAVGSDVSEGLRQIEVLPLVAFYSVDSPNRVVEVLRLGYFVGPTP
jgi:hypothetical protein